jgi:hypothetical protein
MTAMGRDLAVPEHLSAVAVNVSEGGIADVRLSLVDTARIVVDFARNRRRIHFSSPRRRRRERGGRDFRPRGVLGNQTL